MSRPYDYEDSEYEESESDSCLINEESGSQINLDNLSKYQIIEINSRRSMPSIRDNSINSVREETIDNLVLHASIHQTPSKYQFNPVQRKKIYKFSGSDVGY